MNVEPTLELRDVEQVVRLLSETSDPATESSLADRRQLFVEKLARLVGADVWIWSYTAMSQTQPGDGMSTCVFDGGWESPAEQGRVYELLSSPRFSADATQLVFLDMLAGRHATYFVADIMPAARRDELLALWRTTGLEHCILSVHPTNRNFSSNLGLHRRIGREPYTERDRLLVHTVLTHFDWLHRFDTNEHVGRMALELTPRERQTLIFLLAGLSHKEIADRIGISQHTVTDYVKSLHQKFGVSSRAELQAQVYLGRKFADDPPPGE